MADKPSDENTPVDLSRHPSGIVPTLQCVLLFFIFVSVNSGFGLFI